MRTLIGAREPLETLGAALEFKGPTRWEVFASEGSRAILQALALEAPETIDDVVVITSSYRDPGVSFSWHERAEAIDWRTGLYVEAGELALHRRRGSIVADSPDEALGIAIDWADRIADRLGDTFDVVFGDERHIDHGHAERDGRKFADTYLGRF